MSIAVTPLQFPDPDALVETRLMTQVLVAALLPFGMGRGGPKRQPGFPGYSGLLTPAEPQVRAKSQTTLVLVVLVVLVEVLVVVPQLDPVGSGSHSRMRDFLTLVFGF